MKKIVVAIIIVLALFVYIPTAHAVTDACGQVDSTNYSVCCDPAIGGESVGANNMQCSVYEAAHPAKPTKTTTTTTTTSANSCDTLTDTNAGICCQNASTSAAISACQQFYYYHSPSTTTQSPAATASIDSCDPLTDTNARVCCESATTNTMISACQQYYYYNPSSTSQQVGGSAPTTNPVNTANTSYNTGSGAGLAATATDMQAAVSCSAIKFKTLLDIAIWAKCLIGAVVIPGIFTLAFVVFLWGVFKFIRSSDQKDKAESKQFIYMGLIGLFVMVSVWGIIKVAATTFGLDTTVPVLQTDYLSTSKASK